MIEVMAKLLTRCVELVVVVDGGGGEVILADVTIALGKLVAWKSITPSDERKVCVSPQQSGSWSSPVAPCASTADFSPAAIPF